MDNQHRDRLADIIRFYEIMDQLEEKVGGKRLLRQCNGHIDWPKRGVYFFFEPDEMCTTSGNGMRVGRVGTHALKAGSKTTLRDRLRQHRGNLKDGGGNHRGSVFRKHVGAALINRNHWPESLTSNWGIGSNASKEIRQTEKPIEQAVSQYIGEMPFLWIEVDDQPGPNSLRGYLERNTIALLSNYCASDNPINLASDGWLGHDARSEEIRHSGIWNVEHVHEYYEHKFLVVLENIINDSEFD